MMPGTKVMIKGFHQEDAFCSYNDDLIGMVCYVTIQNPVNYVSGFFSGELCVPKYDRLSFYAVRLLQI